MIYEVITKVKEPIRLIIRYGSAGRMNGRSNCEIANIKYVIRKVQIKNGKERIGLH